MSDTECHYLYDISRIQGGSRIRGESIRLREGSTSDFSVMKTLASLLSLTVLAQSALAHCMISPNLFMSFFCLTNVPFAVTLQYIWLNGVRPTSVSECQLAFNLIELGNTGRRGTKHLSPCATQQQPSYRRYFY